MSRPESSAVGATSSTRLSAVLFDMDGVVTDTAHAHCTAWKRLFDEYLRDRAKGAAFEPFEEVDYRKYVDGKPRYDGVRSFLESRGVSLPYGDENGGPDIETIRELGNRKNGYFNAWLEANRIEPFPGTLALMDKLKASGVKIAVFSSSRNAEPVLRSAGVLDLFDARVDGRDMAALGLPGKPDPAILMQSLERLDARLEGAAVVEDASSGVEAGARGGFSPVIGVAREGHRGELSAAGADIVVADLAELDFNPTTGLFVKTLHGLPYACDRGQELRDRLAGKRPVVFLDYDGTLTPIVEDPRRATLSDEMRQAVKRLAKVIPTVIVSGRDLADVRALVGLDDLFYGGSHGFTMSGHGGWRDVAQSKEFLPLTALLDERGLDETNVVPIYLGDDTTDEDAFRTISRRGIGLVVRDENDRPTAARYALADTADVERFLKMLATLGSHGSSES